MYRYLKQHAEGGALVLTFTEPLLNADAVEEALVASAGCPRVVLDCRAVRHLVSGSLYPHWEPGIFSARLTGRWSRRIAGRHTIASAAASSAGRTCAEIFRR